MLSPTLPTSTTSFSRMREIPCTTQSPFPVSQGTYNLTNPPTCRRHVTQFPKLFMANCTRQSSQTQRQRQGHAMMVRPLEWQTTQGGPWAAESSVVGDPLAAVPEEEGGEVEECFWVRRDISKFSRISASSSAVRGRGPRVSGALYSDIPVGEDWLEWLDRRPARRTRARSFSRSLR
jgi:hypothetical protein